MKKHIEYHAVTGDDFSPMYLHGNEVISKCAGCGSNIPNDDIYDTPPDVGCKTEHFESCSQLFEHPEGYFLPHELTHSLENQIELRLPEMEPGAPYSLKNICGKAFWKNLTKQERRIAPTCVNFLIEYQGLPIKIEGFVGKMGYVYQLK